MGTFILNSDKLKNPAKDLGSLVKEKPLNDLHLIISNVILVIQVIPQDNELIICMFLYSDRLHF